MVVARAAAHTLTGVISGHCFITINALHIFMRRLAEVGFERDMHPIIVYGQAFYSSSSLRALPRILIYL